MPAEHSHVADLDQRGVRCACRACYLLFTHSAAARGRYRAIPERYRHDPAPRLTAEQWNTLGIPVRIAFFFRHTALDRHVCFYPSPGGAVEAPIPQDTWDEILTANAALANLEPDVEALLVRRRDPDGFELFAVPIDACYQLVGLVQLRWRSSPHHHAEVWPAIEAFLEQLRARSTPTGGE